MGDYALIFDFEAIVVSTSPSRRIPCPTDHPVLRIQHPRFMHTTDASHVILWRSSSSSDCDSRAARGVQVMARGHVLRRGTKEGLGDGGDLRQGGKAAPQLAQASPERHGTEGKPAILVMDNARPRLCRPSLEIFPVFNVRILTFRQHSHDCVTEAHRANPEARSTSGTGLWWAKHRKALAEHTRHADPRSKLRHSLTCQWHKIEHAQVCELL